MKEYFLNLFEYENWANQEIIQVITAIEEPSEKIISIMSHIINAQILWLSRIENEISEVEVWQQYNKIGLSKIQRDTKLNLENYLQGTYEDDYEKIINYTNTKGESFESSIKDIFTHLTHHSAYHRGQVIILLKVQISNLPYTDYIHYIRSIKRK